VLVLFTHACATSINPEIEIDADLTQIRVMPARRIEIGRAGETPQTAPLKGDGGGPARAFSRRLRATSDDERQRLPIATLEMARAHSVVVCGASEAARVNDVPDEFVRTEAREKDATLRLVPGIESAMRQCVTKRQMLNECGLLNWTQPAGARDVHDYTHFAGPKT
jgi:hypothetical protein